MPSNTTSEQPEVIVKPENPLKWPIVLAFIVLLGGVFLGGVFWLFPKPSPPPLEKPKIAIPCPTDAIFCQNAKPIIKGGRYLGLATNVDEDSPIYAVFDGKTIKRKVIFEKQSEDGFTQITLVNDQKNLKAVYSLKAKISIGSIVKKGDVLAVVSKDPIKFYDDYNLAFTLLDQNNQEIPYQQINFQ